MKTPLIKNTLIIVSEFTTWLVLCYNPRAICSTCHDHYVTNEIISEIKQ